MAAELTFPTEYESPFQSRRRLLRSSRLRGQLFKPGASTNPRRLRLRPRWRTYAILALVIVAQPTKADTLTGNAEIIDGDTISVAHTPIRLFGIDAPEGRQTCENLGKVYNCGKQATRYLANLIAGQPVRCEIVGKEAYDRALGICEVAGININRDMVRSGWSLAFVKYSSRYAADEKAAEAAKAGMWQGSFAKPWEWRLGETSAAQTANECVIKGNVSPHSERIYHLPFQQFYARTRIDESKGERWFCTEQDALDSGWRRALR